MGESAGSPVVVAGDMLPAAVRPSIWQIDEDEPPSYESVMNESSTPSQSIQSDQVLVVPPQRLHVDGVLIWPSVPPAKACYQLSRDLIAGTRITIDRIDHEVYTSNQGNQRLRVRDRSLYCFTHQLFDDSVLEITGKRRDGFPFLLMVKSRSLKGDIWTVHASVASSMLRGSVFFVCKPVSSSLRASAISHEWQDSTGQAIALEERIVNAMNYTSLDILVELEQKIRDLLVTAWCCRVWNHNLKAAGQIRTLMKGKNARGFKS